jgi:hypothetical protein
LHDPRAREPSSHRFVRTIVALAELLLTPSVRSEAVGASAAKLFVRFYPDEDSGQCLGPRVQDAPLGSWTHPILINSDNRPGGCIQEFAVFDPHHELDGVRVTIDVRPDGKMQNQCDNPGPRDIPVSTRLDTLGWSRPYRLDTDDTPDGCRQVFSVEGRSDVALDVDFRADGVVDQCRNTGRHTASADHPVELRLDTDQRAGGCYQRFRLRLITNTPSPDADGPLQR